MPMYPTVLLLESLVLFSAIHAYDSWTCDGVTYRTSDMEYHHPTGVCTQWSETKSWMLVCYASGSIKMLDWDNVECAGNPTSIKDHNFYNGGYISRLSERVTFIEDVCTCNPCSYGKRTERWLEEDNEVDSLNEYVFALNNHCFPFYDGSGTINSGRDKCTSDGRWQATVYRQDDCVDFFVSLYRQDDNFGFTYQGDKYNEWYSCGMANNTCSGVFAPSSAPTLEPTPPTTSPTEWPTAPTMEPTAMPTAAPTAPTLEPTLLPSEEPSPAPTHNPTSPTLQPTSPTAMPTTIPTLEPTTARPSLRPTASPNCANNCEPICYDDCMPQGESAEDLESDEGTGNGCVGFQASRWVFVFAVLALLQ